jgi:zinc transport system substrate-binding protein
MSTRAAAVVVATLLAVLAIAGCSADDDPAGGKLRVVAGFYPLAWMAESVGGSHVEVDSLASGAQEPHDLELAPREVAELVDADVVVYLSGFQPAVDDAVDQAAADGVYDAADHADLDHRDREGRTDPHFWLDPVRFRSVTRAFTAFLASRDPAHRADYEASGARVEAQLTSLDADMRSGLASCTRRELVTSHEAFGYLASRYGLEQVGITGLDPEAEPSPADLAEVTRFVEDHDVRTVYFETLVSSDVADAIAAETGARTAVLDPIEGLTGASAGSNYPEVLRADLASIRRGQPCP